MLHPEDLKKLVAFEQTIESFTISEPPEIEFVGDYKLLRRLGAVRVKITTGGRVFTSDLGDVFVAQVFKRTRRFQGLEDSLEKKEIVVDEDKIHGKLGWAELHPFRQEMFGLRVALHYRLLHEFDLLRADLVKVLKGLVILYHQGKWPNQIYGFVSATYTKTNQLLFRERFIDLAQKNSDAFEIFSESAKVQNDRVVEHFSFNKSMNDDIELICALTYGKNNGYGSYYVTWIRRISESHSYLMPFESKHRYNWKNNPLVVKNTGESLESFVDYVVSEGIKIQEINRTIASSTKEKVLDTTSLYKIFDSILDKAKVAAASKQRCIDYFDEKYGPGKNSIRSSLWAIGESIAYTGTHNKAVPASMKIVLRRLCTALLELGLEEFECKFSKDDFNVFFSTGVPT